MEPQRTVLVVHLPLIDRRGAYAADHFIAFRASSHGATQPQGNVYIPRTFFEVFKRADNGGVDIEL